MEMPVDSVLTGVWMSYRQTSDKLSWITMPMRSAKELKRAGAPPPSTDIPAAICA
jgi:hypothetical protein